MNTDCPVCKIDQMAMCGIQWHAATAKAAEWSGNSGCDSVEREAETQNVAINRKVNYCN